MQKITQKEFDALYTKPAGIPQLQTEIAWYKSGEVIGCITKDRYDDDYGFAVLTKKNGAYSADAADPTMPNEAAAVAALTAAFKVLTPKPPKK